MKEMNWQGILKTYYNHHARFLHSPSDFPPGMDVKGALKEALAVRLKQSEESKPLEIVENKNIIEKVTQAHLQNENFADDQYDDIPEMPPWLNDVEIPDMPEFSGDFDDDFPVDESIGAMQNIKSENLGIIENLDDLRSVWGDCKRCGLSQTRKNLVFGEGNPTASVLFIGEGPGADEDRQGRPFVGKSGELLTRMIEAMGLTRNDVFIANIVKCRPPGNRDPEPGEILSCIPVLRRQIEIINPKLIVCLGRVSAQSLLSTKDSITRLRGSFHKYEGIDLLVTFHPAYLLRSPEKKRDAWADLQLVMERIGLKNG